MALVGEHAMPARDLRLAGALAAIHAAAFAGSGRAWSAPELLALLGEPGVGLRLAHAEVTHAEGNMASLAPAGFALYRVAADEAELLTLAVRPEARRAGLGRALVGAAEAGARAAGARRLVLEVGQGNAPARALYAARGYTEIGRRTGYYALPGGGREDALVLARAL